MNTALLIVSCGVGNVPTQLRKRIARLALGLHLAFLRYLGIDAGRGSQLLSLFMTDQSLKAWIPDILRVYLLVV